MTTAHRPEQRVQALGERIRTGIVGGDLADAIAAFVELDEAIVAARAVDAKAYTEQHAMTFSDWIDEAAWRARVTAREAKR